MKKLRMRICRLRHKSKLTRTFIALGCVMTLLPGTTVFAEPRTYQDETVVKGPADQLDSLVAPIALFPDNLLSQTLAASTYPLEIIQLQQWLDKNQSLAKDQQKLSEAVQAQPWDASIQAMAGLPDLVKRLANDIEWTTALGNAFLAQQTEVMEAVQRMRVKAKDKGALISNEQQKVEVQTVESKEVIVVEQTDPEVVFVPSYDPVYVWGAQIYPYPSIYYPAYYGAWYTAAAITFGVAIRRDALNGGGWGIGWGTGDININRNSNFNRNANSVGTNRVNSVGSGDRANLSSGNRVNPVGSGTRWRHNPAHRGGTPYADRNTANRFGGPSRGDSLADRQRSAQGQTARTGGGLVSTTQPAGVGNRGGIGTSGSGGNLSGIGSGDRVGHRSIGNSSASQGAFGGYNRTNTISSGNRGSSSMSRGSSSGGGGGGFSGGSRGGGRGGGGRR